MSTFLLCVVFGTGGFAVGYWTHGHPEQLQAAVKWVKSKLRRNG